MNFQFMKVPQDSILAKIDPFWLCVLLAIPTSLSGYFSAKYLYKGLESLWAIKFFTEAGSYMVFPILTWLMLGESMFSPKILVSVFLSAIILWIQINW
jgi:hypothetical protein